MAPVGNDKARFIAGLQDTITLFTRLSLLYSNKVRIDGCFAVTVDDGDVIVVNISETHKGHNTTVIYPSLRVYGREGSTYLIHRDHGQAVNKSSQSKTSTSNTTPVFAGRTVTASSSSLTTPCVLKSSGTAHLLLSPTRKVPSTTTTPGVRKTTPLLLVGSAPQVRQPVQLMQSLIQGRRLTLTSVTTSTTSSATAIASGSTNIVNVGVTSSTPSSEPVPSTSTVATGLEEEMSRNVLQSRSDPQTAAQRGVIKSEPAEDVGYGRSRELSRQITEFFHDTPGGAAGATGGGDKENTRRSRTRESAASRADKGDEQSNVVVGKRRRTCTMPQSSTSESAKKSRQSESTPGARRRSETAPAVEVCTQSPRRKSTRLKQRESNVAEDESIPVPVAEEKEERNELQDTSISSSNNVNQGQAPTPSDNDAKQAEEQADGLETAPTTEAAETTTDEEDYTSDDCESTATSTGEEDDDNHPLFRCSEKFVQDCTKKRKRLDELLQSLQKDVDIIGKESEKGVKTKFTRTYRTYQKSLVDLEQAKTRGVKDIKALETKLEKNFETILDNCTLLKTMMPAVLDKYKQKKAPAANIKVKAPPKPTPKPTTKKPSASVLQANKVSKKASKHRAKVAKTAKRPSSSASNRMKRACEECPPCKRTADCAKCIFCLDKTKFGGKNTLRQKCIKKQCLNKGRFKNVRGLDRWPVQV